MEYALTGLPLPLRIRPLTTMSGDELLAFCSKNEFYDIEQEPDGELTIMTPAGSGTGHKNIKIARYLDQWADDDGRGLAFNSNTGFTLPDGAMRSPDAAWVSFAKWNALTQADREKFAPICPEFIIELRSPSDAVPQLQRKMEMWIANGAELAWLIDPIEKAVTIFRPGAAPERQDGSADILGEGTVNGMRLPLRMIFD